jgi:hypothetical protein
MTTQHGSWYSAHGRCNSSRVCTNLQRAKVSIGGFNFQSDEGSTCRLDRRRAHGIPSDTLSLNTLQPGLGRAEFDSPPGSGRNLPHSSPSPSPSPSSCHCESFSLQKKYNPVHSITRMHQGPNIKKASVFPITVAQLHIQTSSQVGHRGRAAVASLPPSRPAPGQTHNNMQLRTVALNAIRQTLCTQPETRVRDITFPASLRDLRYFIRYGEYSDDQPPGRASTI